MASFVISSENYCKIASLCMVNSKNLFVHWFFSQPEGANVKTICGDAVSYCGAKDQKYPDKKPMGFPFDRPMTARTEEELKTDNMFFSPVKIVYLGYKRACYGQ